MAIDPIKIEIANHQFLGDIVTETSAIRDMASMRRCTECLLEIALPTKNQEGVLICPGCGKESLAKKFRIRLNTRFPGVWGANPYVEDYEGEADITLKVGTKIGCKQSNNSGKHITQIFRDAIQRKTGFQFPQGELVPDLHLSEHEKELPPLVEGRYWVICIGKREPFTSKFWPAERWQAVVASLPEITFVQVGHSDHDQPQLRGPNVIDMIGKTQDERTGIRDLFRLVYHADGCCALVSSLMHIAAGFHEPCVVIAGAREPVRFEQYPFHRYLTNQGTMRCVGKSSDDKDRRHEGHKTCFKASVDACPNLEGGYSKCVMMISVLEVVTAIKSYYEGGHLEAISEPAKVIVRERPVFKMVCNARAWGGGERSSAWLADRMLTEGYEVHLHPTGGVSDNYRKALSPYVMLDPPEHPLTEPCDILMAYTNDMVFGLNDKYALLQNVQAKRKVMVLNYRLGAAGKLDWTKTWDRYIFLCSDMEAAFKERVPECDGVVLPPPVDLKPFLDSNFGSLNRTLHVVRVGSQSSQKIPPTIRNVVERIKLVHPSASFSFMGGHPVLAGLDYVKCIEEYSQSVLDILRRGTIFWYMLPENYLDNGPRVIMEAMAAGVPVIADNRGGAKDRITDETGWLCETPEDHVAVFDGLTGKDVAIKGKAARERARAEFDPDRWVEVILDA